MDKGKVKQPDGSTIGYNASTKKVRCAGCSRPIRRGTALLTPSPTPPPSPSQPSHNASSSTHPPPSSIEIAKSIRSLKVILSISAKILRAAAVEKIPITEAMPDIPGWFEGSKAVCEEVLDRYGGLASAGGKVGEMIDMAVRAREVLEEIEEAGGLGREGRT